MNNLPPSWCIAKLGDVVLSINPGFPSGRHNQEQIGIPHLRPMNINYNGNIDLNVVKYVEVANYQEVKKGDILFNNTNSPELLGKTALITKDYNYAYSNHMTRIRINQEHLNSGFLATFLHFLFFKGFFKSNCSHHVNQASIAKSFLEEKVFVPLPPLPEQYRIVAKLEELFSQLDIAVAELKRAKEQIKTYKQSVLASAFSGKLTIDNSQLTIKEETGLPEGWNFTILEEAVKNLQYGTSDKANENPDGIPVLRMGNIQDGLLDYSNLKYFDKSYSDVNKYLLKEGDVLFNRTNSAELVGKTAVYKKHHPKSVFASYLIKIQVDEQKLNPDYLSFYINSIFGREFIKTVVSQNVGQANVNGTKLKSMVLPLPNIQEQNEIVSEIETRFSEAENLEKTIDMGLEQAESMRQSILKKAFEGRLVPQDPNDEPASVLLERIKKCKM